MERIGFTCLHCGAQVREKGSKIRADAKVPCPTCAQEITFAPDSPHDSLRKALSTARKARALANK